MNEETREFLDLPDLGKYPTLELSYILDEMLTELIRREQKAEEIADKLNKKTYQYTHEIELGKPRSRKQKADFYEEMEEHFKTRRIAEQEREVFEKIFSKNIAHRNGLSNGLKGRINERQNWYKTTRRERTVTEERWQEYYQDLYGFKSPHNGL